MYKKLKSMRDVVVSLPAPKRSVKDRWRFTTPLSPKKLDLRLRQLSTLDKYSSMKSLLLSNSPKSWLKSSKVSLRLLRRFCFSATTSSCKYYKPNNRIYDTLSDIRRVSKKFIDFPNLSISCETRLKMLFSAWPRVKSNFEYLITEKVNWIHARIWMHWIHAWPWI